MAEPAVPTRQDIDAADQFYCAGPILGVDGHKRLRNVLAAHRIAALEEAARVAEECPVGQGDDEWDAGASCAKEEIAKAIRSLKEPNNG